MLNSNKQNWTTGRVSPEAADMDDASSRRQATR